MRQVAPSGPRAAGDCATCTPSPSAVAPDPSGPSRASSPGPDPPVVGCRRGRMLRRCRGVSRCPGVAASARADGRQLAGRLLGRPAEHGNVRAAGRCRAAGPHAARAAPARRRPVRRPGPAVRHAGRPSGRPVGAPGTQPSTHRVDHERGEPAVSAPSTSSSRAWESPASARAAARALDVAPLGARPITTLSAAVWARPVCGGSVPRRRRICRSCHGGSAESSWWICRVVR